MDSYIARFFVGRDEEVSRLIGGFEDAEKGLGRLNLVVGEAGSGKTTLVNHFIEEIKTLGTEFSVVDSHCDVLVGAMNSYLPFRDIFNQLITLKEQNKGLSQTIFSGLKETFIQTAPDLIASFVPASELILKVGKSFLDGAGVKESFFDSESMEEKSLDAIDPQKIHIQYLGSVDISSSPDEHGSDFEKSEEINGFLLEA